MEKESGQTLLIVVLVMIVGLTVALALASRSITNLKTSTEEANSQSALSAAEAGVEELLQQSNATIQNQSVGQGAKIIQATSNTSSSTEFLLSGGTAVDKDEGADVWLSDYSADPTLIFKNQWNGTSFTVNWGDPATSCSTSTVAAVEAIVVSGSYSSINAATTQRYVFDPCARGNNFSTSVAGNTVQGKNFAYSATIPVNSSGFIARIIPLYTSTVIGIKACTGCASFPKQGTVITSTGGSGETQRKIVVYQGYPELSTELFPYTLFSSK